MSATARSFVYLAAMARSGWQAAGSIVLVEMAYVTVTAGIYAGMQQKALGIRSRTLGNLIVVVGVPGLSQGLDWTAHRLSGAAVTSKATLGVCVFAAISALFHLHVMRNGAFLTGEGRSLLDDFKRMPRLVLGFVVKPAVFLSGVMARSTAEVESEPAV